MTLANGSRPSYLPTAEVYDTGVYPETIAVLARGSLERLIEVDRRKNCELGHLNATPDRCVSWRAGTVCSLVVPAGTLVNGPYFALI